MEALRQPTRRLSMASGTPSEARLSQTTPRLYRPCTRTEQQWQPHRSLQPGTAPDGGDILPALVGDAAAGVGAGALDSGLVLVLGSGLDGDLPGVLTGIGRLILTRITRGATIPRPTSED